MDGNRNLWRINPNNPSSTTAPYGRIDTTVDYASFGITNPTTHFRGLHPIGGSVLPLSGHLATKGDDNFLWYLAPRADNPNTRTRLTSPLTRINLDTLQISLVGATDIDRTWEGLTFVDDTLPIEEVATLGGFGTSADLGVDIEREFLREEVPMFGGWTFPLDPIDDMLIEPMIIPRPFPALGLPIEEASVLGGWLAQANLALLLQLPGQEVIIGGFADQDSMITLRQVPAGAWTPWAELPEETRQAAIIALSNDEHYDIRVRATGLGREPSDWIQLDQLTLEHVTQTSREWIPWGQAPEETQAATIAALMQGQNMDVRVRGISKGQADPSEWVELTRQQPESQAPTAEGDWIPWPLLAGETPEASIPDLIEGGRYDIRVRGVRRRLAPSAWLSSTLEAEDPEDLTLPAPGRLEWRIAPGSGRPDGILFLHSLVPAIAPLPADPLMMEWQWRIQGQLDWSRVPPRRGSNPGVATPGRNTAQLRVTVASSTQYQFQARLIAGEQRSPWTRGRLTTRASYRGVTGSGFMDPF